MYHKLDVKNGNLPLALLKDRSMLWRRMIMICVWGWLAVAGERALGANQSPVVLAIDSFCPYVCAREDAKIDETRPGAYVEAVRAIARMLMIEVEFRIMPFSRALRAVDQNEVHGMALVTMARADSFVLTSEPVAPAQSCFFKRRDDDWEFKANDSLKSRRLGLVQDYRYQFIDDYVAKNRNQPNRVQFVTGSDPLRRNLSKLVLKRIDLTYDNRWVGEELLRTHKWDDRVVMSHCAPAQKFYTGFSFRFPKAKEMAAAFSDGFRKLRASGELKRIWERYGMEMICSKGNVRL